MNNPSRLKLTIITIIFFIGGFWGLYVGIFLFVQPNFFLTILGMVNISLGIYMAFRMLRKNTMPSKKEK